MKLEFIQFMLKWSSGVMIGASIIIILRGFLLFDSDFELFSINGFAILLSSILFIVSLIVNIVFKKKRRRKQENNGSRNEMNL